ncbi:MAG: hypothetical protein Q6M04_08295 [Thermostichus sp. BF3_bins_97]
MTEIPTLITDLGVLLSWSRAYCGWVCGALVPACLMITLQVLLFTAFGYPQRWIPALACLFWVGLLEAHVLSWFWVGVVRIPTFVLIGLGVLCLVLAGWAMVFPTPLQRLGQWTKGWLRGRPSPLVGRSENAETGGIAV